MENRSAKDTMNAKYPKYAKVKPIRIGKHNWIDRELTSAPVWCSVDLRDGNQALPMPMNPEKKLEYFKLLCAVGFKEIEVSFPSASQDDFDFVRKLIVGNEIPQDVRISVLTQARENLIRRTVESLKGLDRGILQKMGLGGLKMLRNTTFWKELKWYAVHSAYLLRFLVEIYWKRLTHKA